MSGHLKRSYVYGGYADPAAMRQVGFDIRAANRPDPPAILVSAAERKAALLRIWQRMRKEGHFPDPITEVIND